MLKHIRLLVSMVFVALALVVALLWLRSYDTAYEWHCQAGYRGVIVVCKYGTLFGHTYGDYEKHFFSQLESFRAVEFDRDWVSQSIPARFDFSVLGRGRWTAQLPLSVIVVAGFAISFGTYFLRSLRFSLRALIAVISVVTIVLGCLCI